MNIRQSLNRTRVRLRVRGRVAGWDMTPGQAAACFEGLGRTVVTFFGYVAGYEDQKAMLEIVRSVLGSHAPDSTLINYGATRYGLGEIYPLAKSMGFMTAGIISSLAAASPGDLSRDIDQLCFIQDERWGGNLPDGSGLSPTSRAMVAVSDILVGIGGGEISRDELLDGREQGKPVIFYPADVRHAWLIRRMQRQGQPPPTSFRGAAGEVFGSDADQHAVS